MGKEIIQYNSIYRLSTHCTENESMHLIVSIHSHIIQQYIDAEDRETETEMYGK